MTMQEPALLQTYGSSDDLDRVIGRLLEYCRREDWAGFDPYDALNSKLFDAVPLLNTRLCRLAFTQALKRCPVNFRGLALIPKTQNPKALALFLSAFLKLPAELLPDRKQLIQHMMRRLMALRSPQSLYWCWGYSFPWQGRGILVPRGAANLVCTTFVANSLIDLFEQTGHFPALEMAISATDYIFDQLYWVDENGAGFSYPLPSLRGQVHNANLLGAALLCRAYRHAHKERFLSAALLVARQSVQKQRDDGSWYYGESPTQRWIDNFHSGYNLLALQTIARELDTREFNESLERGFTFYRNSFFRADGAPRYFHNRSYPIDAHCVAQSILTLVALQNLWPGSRGLAESVFRWAMTHMWSERGFFYYRVLRACTIRTSYMRWAQAWMLLALATMRPSLESSTGHEPADAAVLLHT
jgi:hypothetical protein